MARDLDEAADVAGCQDVGAGGGHGAGLARAEGVRDVRVFDVVEACRSAADVAIRDVDDPYVRDRREQRARRAADALCVREVAGVVIGHDQRFVERRTTPSSWRGPRSRCRSRRR